MDNFNNESIIKNTESGSEKFDIVKTIGKGGFGKVYIVDDGHRKFAIKRIIKDGKYLTFHIHFIK